MKEKLLKILFGFLIAGLIVEVGYLHWRVESREKDGPEFSKAEVLDTLEQGDDLQEVPLDEKEASCLDQCTALVDDRIAQVVATFSAQPVVEPEKPVTASIPIATAPSAVQITYLPLGAGGSTTARDWTDVTGSRFSFNLAEYGGSVTVTWEANLRAQDANSRCYVRIYDASNFRAVDFSEQTTDSTTSVNLMSLPLSIWQGNNNYYLEVKSLNGVRCYLDSPRFKIVSR